MQNAETLQAIDKGISLWWGAIGKARGFSHHAGDVEWVLSDGRTGPERIYNVRLKAEMAGGRLDELAAGMKLGALPGGMLLTPLSTPATIVELLVQRGFQVDDSCPCMALELAAFRPVPPDSRIGAIPVLSLEMLRIWADIVNTGLFGCELFSPEQYEDMFRQENTSLWLASLDGRPASACMTIREAGTATLECVSTLPEFRRKGLGAAVVSHAMDELRAAGVSVVTLRSEPDAISLYRKLGFVEYCRRIVASVAG